MPKSQFQSLWFRKCRLFSNHKFGDAHVFRGQGTEPQLIFNAFIVNWMQWIKHLKFLFRKNEGRSGVWLLDLQLLTCNVFTFVCTDQVIHLLPVTDLKYAPSLFLRISCIGWKPLNRWRTFFYWGWRSDSWAAVFALHPLIWWVCFHVGN